jgi:DNA-binding transcriptional MerR regulator
VRFISAHRSSDFTLAQVRVLLHLAEGGPDGCDRARAQAEERITDVQRRIGDLHLLRAGLARLVATCERPRLSRECPILGVLAVPIGDLPPFR